jgi:hypothetical protein
VAVIKSSIFIRAFLELFYHPVFGTFGVRFAFSLQTGELFRQDGEYFRSQCILEKKLSW